MWSAASLTLLFLMITLLGTTTSVGCNKSKTKKGNSSSKHQQSMSTNQSRMAVTGMRRTGDGTMSTHMPAPNTPNTTNDERQTGTQPNTDVATAEAPSPNQQQKAQPTPVKPSEPPTPEQQKMPPASNSGTKKRTTQEAKTKDTKAPSRDENDQQIGKNEKKQLKTSDKTKPTTTNENHQQEQKPALKRSQDLPAAKPDFKNRGPAIEKFPSVRRKKTKGSEEQNNKKAGSDSANNQKEKTKRAEKQKTLDEKVQINAENKIMMTADPPDDEDSDDDTLKDVVSLKQTLEVPPTIDE